MNTDCPESVLKQWFRRVWNEEDASAIAELATQDLASHGLLETIRGAEKWQREFYEPMLKVFSSVRVESCEEVTSGNKIFGMQEATVTLRATGKEAKMRGACLVHLREGKIAEAWDTWDFLGLLEGMNLMPAGSFGRAMSGALSQHPMI